MIHEVNNGLASSTTKIDNLKEKVASIEPLTKQVLSLEKDVTEIHKRLDGIDKELKSFHRRFSEMTEKMDTLSAKVNEVSVGISAELRDSKVYLNGRIGDVESKMERVEKVISAMYPSKLIEVKPKTEMEVRETK